MATCSRASVPRASPRARDAGASRRAVWSRRASRTSDARAGRASTHARDAFPPSVGGRSSYASLWTVEEASSRPPPAPYASAPRRLARHGASASADRPLVVFTSADPRDDDGDPSSVPSSSSAVLPPPTNNPPVTRGPIIRPRTAPRRASASASASGSPSTEPDADASAVSASRAAAWNRWWVDAVASENLEALDMLAAMPWADASIAVSSMRMMREPSVFRHVVDILADPSRGFANDRGGDARTDAALETRERVGGLTALAWAAKKGNADACAALVAAGARVDARDHAGVTPALHAAVANSPTALEVLLRSGANPNLRGGGGFGAGARGGDADNDNDADASGDGSSAPDASASTCAGWSPLTWASRKGHASTVELLLEAGADPDGRGGPGNATPMIQAAMGGHASVVELLAAAGADPDARDDEDFTAAMHAGFRHPQNERLMRRIAEASVAARRSSAGR
jgi:hypothetical protein